MANMNGTTSILGGPSREELFDSLRLYNEQRKLTFELLDKAINKVKVMVTVTGLKVEDGSGNNWIIYACITLNGRGVQIDGYYNTVRRTGHFNIP